ncbi:hypothetical protein DUNSADRAFT_1937 [Dunaliella salina]|uniref:Encoded protein n=1 Tax=Dunaliella salina TaxID=3046 RepID=A0ABQ7GWD6_DUNSA|nr:hypothetical protein DUNSADRAFT_1937 [Dunaliella salina]|eukprot:KAF5838921.1 hypothetical protein DUNSADRAFT_1937 [Dunaliella salina]
MLCETKYAAVADSPLPHRFRGWHLRHAAGGRRLVLAVILLRLPLPLEKVVEARNKCERAHMRAAFHTTMLGRCL